MERVTDDNEYPNKWVLLEAARRYGDNHSLELLNSNVAKLVPIPPLLFSGRATLQGVSKLRELFPPRINDNKRISMLLKVFQFYVHSFRWLLFKY